MVPKLDNSLEIDISVCLKMWYFTVLTSGCGARLFSDKPILHESGISDRNDHW
jgi:hypothetical protein